MCNNNGKCLECRSKIVSNGTEVGEKLDGYEFYGYKRFANPFYNCYNHL